MSLIILWFTNNDHKTLPNFVHFLSNYKMKPCHSVNWMLTEWSGRRVMLFLHIPFRYLLTTFSVELWQRFILWTLIFKSFELRPIMLDQSLELLWWLQLCQDCYARYTVRMYKQHFSFNLNVRQLYRKEYLKIIPNTHSLKINNEVLLICLNAL